jgi:hypothetical protein
MYLEYNQLREIASPQLVGFRFKTQFLLQNKTQNILRNHKFTYFYDEVWDIFYKN